VLNAETIDIRTGRTLRPNELRIPGDPIDNLPDVPVLPETLLMMELRSHEFSIDLQEMSQLVLGDLGAVLQILRLAAREYEDAAERPTRIEDCISALGIQACLKAAAQQTILSDMRHGGVLELWAHAREVAQACRTVAATAGGAVQPEEAYLVGLTHALGSLPGLLGWQRPGPGCKRWEHAGTRLAECWSLPLCIQEFSTAWNRSDLGNPWVEIVRIAHRVARHSPQRCPLYLGLTPQLQPAL
jgi:hypothetical protein